MLTIVRLVQYRLCYDRFLLFPTHLLCFGGSIPVDGGGGGGLVSFFSGWHISRMIELQRADATFETAFALPVLPILLRILCITPCSPCSHAFLFTFTVQKARIMVSVLLYSTALVVRVAKPVACGWKLFGQGTLQHEPLGIGSIKLLPPRRGVEPLAAFDRTPLGATLTFFQL